MIVSTEVNTDRFKKWVNFEEGEKCVAWFSKGFVSYKKGWLFTDQRLIEFEKKNTLQNIPLSQCSEINFDTKLFTDEPALNLKSVEGSLRLVLADGKSVVIPVDDSYDGVLEALKAVDEAIEVKMTFSGQEVFSASLSAITMRLTGKTVFVRVDEHAFAKVESDEQTKTKLFGDTSHIETVVSKPQFQFVPKCAWTGASTNNGTREVTVQTSVMDLKDVAALEAAGKALKSIFAPNLIGGNPQKSTIRFTAILALPVAEGVAEDAPSQIDLNLYADQGKIELGITFPATEEGQAFMELNG